MLMAADRSPSTFTRVLLGLIIRLFRGVPAGAVRGCLS